MDEENINPEEQQEENRRTFFYDNQEDENDITKVTECTRIILIISVYVILERAVPANIEDGFKPVQRRINMHSKEFDDARHNKIANVVGHTMQYHPHGDASIATPWYK
jgi:topoisomerase-4 subunit A